ncbi:MAG: RNA 2',3'-cyclic phosphodiesterase [Candidatus Woesearchaeota archaeon]
MRLFIALDFVEHKDYFIKLQEEFSKPGRYSLPKSFHLTLKFLGEVPDSNISQIKDALSKVSFKPFSLRLNRLGVFPSLSYVRVLWVDVLPLEEVSTLQRSIDAALRGWFAPDNRFHPHITLARVKSIADKQKFDELLNNQVEVKTVVIESFNLIRSVLSSKGPSYELVDGFRAQDI